MRGVFFLICCFLAVPAPADTPIGKVVLNEFNLKGAEIEKLEKGGVLTRLASEYEQSPRELAIDSTIIIRRPLQDLIAESEDNISLVPGKMILDSAEILDNQAFEEIEFDPGEEKEARRWLNARRGDDLNLGVQDLEIIARVRKEMAGKPELEVGTQAVREVLRHRFNEYRAFGLDGIEPYARAGKKLILAGDELKASNQALDAIEKHFPLYYDSLVNYPVASDCCENRFMWMKAKIRKRPTFVLVHRIVEDSEAYALVTERHIYVSHSLNSLQLTLGWLPYDEADDATYLGIATSANSDYLTGFVGKMIRVLGANKGAKMMGEVLVDIRDDLEAGIDPAEQFEN